MKKVVGLALAFLGALFLAGCESPMTSGGAEKTEFGSIVVPSPVVQQVVLTKDSQNRYLDVSEIESATVKVWVSKNESVTKETTILEGEGEVTIENIPTGSNRVIEVIGYKANGVEGKRLYYVTNIQSGINKIETIKEGAESCKGKAYLALMNAGINISSVSLTGFTEGKSSYYFDADSFASAYKTNANTSPSSYYTAAKSVVLSSIIKASGYTVWVSDPLSSRFVIDSDETTTGTIENVAPGSWYVYVNDGNTTIKAGTVTVSSENVTFSETIGNPYNGHMVVYVSADSAPRLWIWQVSGSYTDGSTVLGCEWDNRPTMSAADGMKDNSGWYMYDLTENNCKYTEGIAFNIKLNDGDNVATGKTSTFWYDEKGLCGQAKTLYDSDPTVGKLSSDATLSSISVNGLPLEGFASGTTNYTTTITSDTTTAIVTANASDTGASVSISPSGSTKISAGESQLFTITVTAEDGETVKTYSVTVKRAVENDTTLSSISVNGKSAAISGTTASVTIKGKEDSLSVTSIVATPVDANATVTYSATSGTVADGASKSFTITVKNGTNTATYTLTVSYTKQVLSGQYGTNDKGYGVNKTISSWSDWTEDMQIARGAAYDDPRTWKGIQETSYDAYALYAAYDDTNLYLMVELTNLPDNRATFMNHNYAGSDNAWWDNRDCPLGFIINTGKGTTATAPLVGSASGKPIWDAINFTDSEGFDFLFYGSSKYGYADHKSAFVGVGTPGFFKLNPSTGYFSYDAEYCLSANSGAPGSETAGTSGISVRYIRQCQVSSTVNFESTPTDNRETSGQTGEDLMESETYTSVETNDLDMSYWYTIPLATLGIDKAYITSHGIGVRQLTPNGGSLMDCLPWDVSMVDNATEPCSDDPSTSQEKEDKDDITSAQARIGK